MKLHTLDTAALMGLADRGALLPGMRADMNIIDLPRLTVHCPQFVRDLPRGAARWTQASLRAAWLVVASLVGTATLVSCCVV